MARSRIVNLANFEQFTAINLLSDPGHIGGPKIIPNAAEIRLRFTLEDGKVGHIVTCGGYAGTFAGTVAQANAIFAALGTGAQWSALAAFLATTTAFAGVDIRDLNSAGNPYISSTAAASPGTSASTALPNEVAAVITLLTAKTGPQNRGRMYVPGWATNALGAGNVIAAAAQSALGAWSGQFAGAYSAQGYVHSIAQPARAAYTGSSGTQHPARVATKIAVTSTALKDNHWDSQRRRGLK
jgi:hypothetical protein